MSAPSTAAALLARILDGTESAYALVQRASDGPRTVDVLIGRAEQLTSLAEIPSGRLGSAHTVLALVPYRQIAERGFAAVDDGEPLTALHVTERLTAAAEEITALIPDVPIAAGGLTVEPSDEEYAATVARVVAREIGNGEGANFVIRRTFSTEIARFGPAAALAYFGRLLEREQSAYWTFLVHVGGRTFVGATPERHLVVREGTAVMNPISGTYRFPEGGPTAEGLAAFLADRKEVEELYMVLDEELKMMARLCPGGGRVIGPRLKQMARLAHTEYLIEGETVLDVRDALRETLFAPTVTGGPVASAARVISRYEPDGRGYYGGVLALIEQDAAGRQSLDSAIMIRTADIGADGRVRVDVGATLVRGSDPAAEAAETRAKAAALLAALAPARDAAKPRAHVALAALPGVAGALQRRNEGMAGYWFTTGADIRDPRLTGVKAMVVDAEDAFTQMLRCQLEALGMAVDQRRHDEPADRDAAADLVVMGPGPGDPRAAGDPKIARLSGDMCTLLAERRPFVAVCLSHQVLCTLLGLELVRRPVPDQGVQRRIELYGRTERVGFYNTFTARALEPSLHAPGIGRVRAFRDPRSHDVHALQGPFFASLQFHAESVLTVDGPRILAQTMRRALNR